MRRNHGIHARRHPYFVEGCWHCNVLSQSISPHAMPTRSSPRFTETDQLEKNWQKDIPAYRRLVSEGLQPEGVDGAAELEKRAETKEQIEGVAFEPIVSDA